MNIFWGLNALGAAVSLVASALGALAHCYCLPAVLREAGLHAGFVSWRIGLSFFLLHSTVFSLYVLVAHLGLQWSEWRFGRWRSADGDVLILVYCLMVVTPSFLLAAFCIESLGLPPVTLTSTTVTTVVMATMLEPLYLMFLRHKSRNI